MKSMNIVTAAVAAFGFWIGRAPVVAQHEGHQTSGMAASSTANVGGCAQNAVLVTSAIDLANARVEEARQLNDPAKLRAAVADVQLTLTQMKAQLADCVALNQPATGNMPGVDHSKMNMTSGAAATAPGSTTAAQPMSHANMPGMEHSTMPMRGAGAAPASEQSKASGAAQTSALDIALKTDPSPAHAGDNKFEVTVKDKGSKPISDASVSLAFYMPPMGSMGAMRNTVTLASAGTGVYRGEGTVGMAGDWEVTITVTRGQQHLGSKKIKLAAQ